MTDRQSRGSRRKSQALLVVWIMVVLATTYSTPSAVAAEGVTRLRVTDHDGTRRVETFSGLQGDTLLLVDRSNGESRAIPFSRIETVERSRGRHGHSLAGAGIGLGTGLILGAALGAASQPDESAPIFGNANFSAAGAFYLGVGGAVVGALAGTFWQSEKWRPVPVKDLHVMVGLSGPGTPGILIARRF